MAIHGGVTDRRDLRRSWLRRAFLVAGLVIGSWLALTLAAGTAQASPDGPPAASGRAVPDRLGAALGDVAEPLGRTLGRTATQSAVEPVAEKVVRPAAERVVEPVTEKVVRPAAEQVVEPVTEKVLEPVVAPVVDVVEPVVAPILTEVSRPVLEPVLRPVVVPVVDEVVGPAVAPVLEPLVTPTTESVDILAPAGSAERPATVAVAVVAETRPAPSADEASSADEPSPARAQAAGPRTADRSTATASLIAPSRSPLVPDDRPYGGEPSAPASAPTSSTGLTTGGPGPSVGLPPHSAAPYLPTARGPVTSTPAGELADGVRPEPSFSPD